MKSTRVWFSLIGLTVLALAVLSLLVLTLIEAWVFHYLGGVIVVIVLIGAGLAIFYEAKKHLGRTSVEGESSFEPYQGLAVIVGGLAAYALAHELGLGPVIAASLVGLAGFVFLPNYSVAAYCGAFVGMTSDLLLFNWFEVGLAGLIAAVVFILTKDLFPGVGGKLGTIALIGTVLACTCLHREFILVPIADMQTNTAIMITAMTATPLTFFINTKQGPVFASAFVGLAGGLILPALFPQIGSTLAVVAICASFTGMTSQARCPRFRDILITGFFTGVVFVYSTPLVGGAGGKLGTIAFAAVLATCGLKQLFGWNNGRHRSGRQNQGA